MLSPKIQKINQNDVRTIVCHCYMVQKYWLRVLLKCLKKYYTSQKFSSTIKT